LQRENRNGATQEAFAGLKCPRVASLNDAPLAFVKVQ